MASFAGPAVRAQALKERPTQVNAPCTTICAGKAVEVEKWKKIVKVNVCDSRTRAKGDQTEETNHEALSDRVVHRTAKLLT
jgi:hypothetical protein